MASKTQICNLAITRLAASRITDLSDPTKIAADCNAIYEFVAENAMSLGPWPSIKRRVQLAQDADAPAFGYSYSYTLPTDPKFLRVYKINECVPGEINYTIEGNKLLTNESSMNLIYLSYITDSNAYDIYLRQSIVDFLTAELAYTTTGNQSAYINGIKYANEHAHDLLSQASVGQSSADEVNSDTFIDARNDIWPIESRLRDS